MSVTHSCPTCGDVHLPPTVPEDSNESTMREPVQWLCGDCQHPTLSHDVQCCRKPHCPCASRYGQSDRKSNPEPRGSES